MIFLVSQLFLQDRDENEIKWRRSGDRSLCVPRFKSSHVGSSDVYFSYCMSTIESCWVHLILGETSESKCSSEMDWKTLFTKPPSYPRQRNVYANVQPLTDREALLSYEVSDLSTPGVWEEDTKTSEHLRWPADTEVKHDIVINRVLASAGQA